MHDPDARIQRSKVSDGDLMWGDEGIDDPPPIAERRSAGATMRVRPGWRCTCTSDGQMLFLAQHGFRVVAHDRRGHG